MHKKKVVIVSRLSAPLRDRPTRRILLSRETIRTLTAEELSRAAGGGEHCPCGSDTSSGGTAL